MIRIGRLRGKMGMTMTAEAVEARKAYQREYRRRNRDKINSQRKKLARGEPGQGAAV